MLESKISGIKIMALSTSVPLHKKTAADESLYYVSEEIQTSSDLGFDAAERILSKVSIAKDDIGILLFGSRTPDYRSPNTAAVLQGRLGLSVDCVCFDTNVGANGFVKMTQVASALLANSTSKYALIIVGDTPSKLSNEKVTIDFEISDAATAVLIQKSTSNDVLEFLTFSDGTHFKASYLKEGGFRNYGDVPQFDASIPENFIVKSEEQDLLHFYKNISPLVDELIKDAATLSLVHSSILKNLALKDAWKEQRSIYADASELPLLLENIKNANKLTSNSIQFITTGEGMALMVMKMNYIPEILPINYTLDHFEDYKVSHEM